MQHDLRLSESHGQLGRSCEANSGKAVLPQMLHALFVALVLLSALATCSQAKAGEFKEVIRAPAKSLPLPAGRPLNEISFDCDLTDSRRCSIEQFMDRARVCAMLVIKSGRIVLQKFSSNPELCADDDGIDRTSNGREKLYGLASITKSVVSALIGIGVAERMHARTKSDFESVMKKPVNDFLGGLGPIDSNGGYTNVPLERVLGMRSGIRWREYGWMSDSDLFSRNVKERGTHDILEWAQKMRPVGLDRSARPFKYSAMDASLAGLIAERIVEEPGLVKFAEEGLWSGMGAEHDMLWRSDKRHTPIGACCSYASIEDLGRFGLLYLRKGRSQTGRQIIPAPWIELTTQHGPGRSDQITPGNPDRGRSCTLEYRYFWWLFPAPRTDFTAIGVGGQYVHVFPDQDAVVVQFSDWGKDYFQCDSFKAHQAMVNQSG